MTGRYMWNPQRALLADGRRHWQQGPIDLIIGLEGEQGAIAQSEEEAWEYFQSVLSHLVEELSILRLPVSAETRVKGEIAQRMVRATLPYAKEWITPMAAVAGSVAERLIEFFGVPSITKAWINNGGDIAFHLVGEAVMEVGIVNLGDRELSLATPTAISETIYEINKPGVPARFCLDAQSPIRGIATSGWRGRSFSLGIADHVTVLADQASSADAAATMIANVVNIEHPCVQRAPANTLKDDTDLGSQLVTIGVGSLPNEAKAFALEAGEQVAWRYYQQGLIRWAVLCLQGEYRIVGMGLGDKIGH